MRTQSLPAGQVDVRPYPPSWVDRLGGWIARLPGPAWLFYLLFTFALVLGHAATKWWDGTYPVGTFYPFHIVVTASALVVIALITFLWPLLGIHRRLVEHKACTKAEAGQRIKACIAELHRRIDDGLSGDMDPPTKALEGLKQEHDLLDRIPTWPWQPETVRTFVTAILLPVVLWFINRLLERLFTF